MKAIYSLQEFHNKAFAIAQKKGIEYVSVRVELSSIKNTPVFSCYAHGYEYYNASTMEESLKQLHKAVCPEDFPVPNIDVEIETEITNS